MSQFPTNSPEGISVGDPIRADFLNRVKRQGGKISVNAPLTITQTSVGDCIGFEKGYSYLRWGIVTQPPRSDYGYVLVHSVKGFNNSSNEVNRDIKVFFTNPAYEQISDIASDVYSIPSDSIVAYLNFSSSDSNDYGMLLGGDSNSTSLAYGRPTSDFTNSKTINLSPCDPDGNTSSLSDVVVRTCMGNRTFEGKLTSSDVCAYITRITQLSSDVSIGDMVGVRNGTHVEPDELYNTYEGVEDPQTDAWVRTDQTGDGLIIPVITRVGYWDSGDEILYGYYRNLMIDSAGMAHSVGSEIQYIIDEPVECTPTDIDGGTY